MRFIDAHFAVYGLAHPTPQAVRLRVVTALDAAVPTMRDTKAAA